MKKARKQVDANSAAGILDACLAAPDKAAKKARKAAQK